jgi:hypothetical protein
MHRSDQFAAEEMNVFERSTCVGRTCRTLLTLAHRMPRDADTMLPSYVPSTRRAIHRFVRLGRWEDEVVNAFAHSGTRDVSPKELEV